jgi:hypothetical protein
MVDDVKPKAGTREGGLKVARQSALPRDAGLGPKTPSGPGASLQAERRLKLAAGLLAVCLLLGIGQIAEFYVLNFPAAGTPGAYSGQLRDTANQSLIENASVFVVAGNFTVVSREDGNFTLTNVSAGVTHLVVTKANYTTTTFIVFVTPSPNGQPPLVADGLRLDPGHGNATVDFTGARGTFVAVCLTIVGIGVALNGLGLTAALSRRRYQHALLGGVGAFLAIGFFLGALLGLISIFLLRGARHAFGDQRALFTPSDVPSLLEEEDDDEDEEDEGSDEEGGAAGPPSSAAPANGGPRKEDAPR